MIRAAPAQTLPDEESRLQANILGSPGVFLSAVAFRRCVQGGSREIHR